MNERSKFAMVSDGTSFEYRPRKQIIDQIIENMSSIFVHYIEDNREQLGETVVNKYNIYKSRLDSDKEFRNQSKVSITATLLNMKSLIDNDERIRKSIHKLVD
jgi:hypothetical protein